LNEDNEYIDDLININSEEQVFILETLWRNKNENVMIC